MTLKFNDETKSYNVEIGNLHEIAKVIENAEDIIHDPATDLWEVDGVKFSTTWLTDQVIMMSHFINIVARMHVRKGTGKVEAVQNNEKAIEQLNGGKVPGTRQSKKKKS